MSDGNGPLAFSCDVAHADPETPGFVTSTQAAALKALPRSDPRWIRSLRTFDRKFFGSGKLIMPDGREVRHWGFTDDASGEIFPSPPIRVIEGDLAQVRMKAGTGVHTIHHHGIEPDAFNDGVGHTSFEAGEYTYQWRARHAGTYFYHCHVNTVLHVQMGLFGALIIDPEPVAGIPTGYKQLFKDGPVYKVATERIWALVAFDPRWHDLNHAAGLCGEDVGLNRFEPKYFLIGNKAQVNGAVAPKEGTPGGPAVPPRPPITDARVAVTAKTGEPILLRILNANYFPAQITFAPPVGSLGPNPLSPEVHGSDGRSFRTQADCSGLTQTGALAHRTLGGVQKVLNTTPAERWDLLMNTAERPTPPGVYPVSISFQHWITRRVVGIVNTSITINP